MLTVNKLIPQGRGLAAALLRRAATVELEWDVRCRSRFDATDSLGRALGVFLPRGTTVRGGDLLVAEDGSLVRVLAAVQPVLVVRPEEPHGSAFDLLRAAYHLGNRHVQVELRPDHLKLEPDHVLAELLRRSGLVVTDAHFPFEPEVGAYAGGGHAPGHGPAPDHGHDHDHDHDHGGSHGHGAARDHGPAGLAAAGAVPAQPRADDAGHVHGPDCGHDHRHGHGHKHDH